MWCLFDKTNATFDYNQNKLKNKCGNSDDAVLTDSWITKHQF